jgi:hypothetical protein
MTNTPIMHIHYPMTNTVNVVHLGKGGNFLAFYLLSPLPASKLSLH